MIKAVIFDFDGVIVETDSFNYKIFNKLFKESNIKFNKKIYKDFFFGKTLKEVVPEYLSKFGRINESVTFIDRKKKLFDNCYFRNVVLYEDAFRLIKILHKHKYKLAITSGTRRNLMEMALEKFNIKQYFNLFLTAENYTQGKPNPQPYLLALKKLGLKSNEAVVVEDSSAGIRSSVSAGIYCIAVEHTHKRNELLLANKIVTSLDELDPMNLLK